MARFFDVRSGRDINTTNQARIRAYRRQPERYTEQTAVPAGTVPEILAWVGDDPDRRAAALAAEKVGLRRKGILDAL